MASRVCGFGAFKIYLMLLNAFYIGISLFLIGLVIAARTFAYQIASFYVVIGVAVVASILFIVAVLGIIATLKHHQVIMFFYMVTLGLCGVTLLVVSIAALAIPKEQQKQLFQEAWKSLTLKQKMDIQDSLDCCGFDTANRYFIQNGTETGDCQLGHPTCDTPILRLQCCREQNRTSHSYNEGNQTCQVEMVCLKNCLPCYNSWESNVTAGINAAGSFGLIFSFTQIIGIVMVFRYRNLKDPSAIPGAFL